MNTEKPEHSINYYFNKLRQLNPGACKTKEGLSALMKEARYISLIIPLIEFIFETMKVYKTNIGIKHLINP